jgi:Outer membrane protein beta-barrel domain
MLISPVIVYILDHAKGAGMMSPTHSTRTGITVLLLQALFFAGFFLSSGTVSAGTPDRAGNNADIYSISITPNQVLAGTYPAISGFVHNTSSAKNGKSGKAVFDVIAVITTPNKSRKRLVWNNVSFAAGQKKYYTFLHDYDSTRAGTYHVVYSVYSSGRTHLYASLSKSFTVTNIAITSRHRPSSGKTSKATHEGKSGQQAARARESIAIERKKPSSSTRRARTESGEERAHFGVGAFVNTLNFSAGPGLILWPSENWAIQGSYGFGTFTSYEVRTFYRFPLASSVKPYVGVGYIHAERKANVIGVDTLITGDSVTGFVGVELPVSKTIHAYIDVSGTPMKLQKDVTNGGTATVTVTYNPVTVNIGVMWYLF